MAVVTKYGTGYRDPASLLSVDAVMAEARILAILSKVAIANGDSATSVYYVGRVPSNSIILPMSRIDFSAVTGASASLGFAGAAAALLAATSIATAGNAALSVAAANQNNRAWQLAGFSSDPGGMLDVILTLTVAAAADGTVEATLLYGRK